MPGSGKSTLGILLAKSLSKNFVDTDVLLQLTLKQSLQTYLDSRGFISLRKQEEQIILRNNFSNCVISTGGSVIYSQEAMEKLRNLGCAVYLDISYKTLIERVINAETRGLACPNDYTLKDLYTERQNLYEFYADIVIDNNFFSQEQALQQILHRLKLANKERNI